MTAVTAVTAMHEEVHAEANQERQQKGQGTENMRTMLKPQKHACSDEKNTECKSSGSVQERSTVVLVEHWIA
jgi:hypothetical protein